MLTAARFRLRCSLCLSCGHFMRALQYPAEKPGLKLVLKVGGADLGASSASDYQDSGERKHKHKKKKKKKSSEKEKEKHHHKHEKKVM